MRRKWLPKTTLVGFVALVTALALTPTMSALASSSSSSAGRANRATNSQGAAGGADWTSWGRDLSNSRYAGPQLVNPATVSQLKYKWAFTFPLVPGVNPGSQPAVLGNTLYVGSSDAKFYALNAKTGTTKWVFNLVPVSGAVSSGDVNPVRDSPAVVNGTVYFGDERGWIYALNEYTGKLRWATRIGDQSYSRITASPVVYGGRVFVGVSQMQANLQLADLNYPCCSGRGLIDALDAATGAVLWTHYTVGVPQPVGTWPSGATEYAPSGGSVEDAVAIDPAAHALYFGTGQNDTGTNGETDSLVALNIDTGKLLWYQKAQIDTYTTICDDYPNYPGYCPQAADGTAHDWDISAGPNLFTIGHRKVVGIGEKSGVYRVFDALTGKLIWSQRVTPPPAANALGGSAGVQWGTSYDGKRLYVATWMANPGVLYALDPATGAILWQTSGPADGCTTGGAASSKSCTLGFTPAVSSSLGLVYEGSTDGKMYIFSAATGDLLWQFDTDQQFNGVNGVVGHGESLSGLGGTVVSGGMVYVQSGYYPLKTPANTLGTVLLAFGLPGQ